MSQAIRQLTQSPRLDLVLPISVFLQGKHPLMCPALLALDRFRSQAKISSKSGVGPLKYTASLIPFRFHISPSEEL